MPRLVANPKRAPTRNTRAYVLTRGLLCQPLPAHFAGTRGEHIRPLILCENRMKTPLSSGVAGAHLAAPVQCSPAPLSSDAQPFRLTRHTCLPYRDGFIDPDPCHCVGKCVSSSVPFCGRFSVDGGLA